MPESELSPALILLAILLPIVVAFSVWVTINAQDVHGSMRKAFKKAQRKYKDRCVYLAAAALLPAIKAEPGVLIMFVDGLKFQPLGGQPLRIWMSEIRKREFRAPTPDDVGMETARILRIETANGLWEIGVHPSTERFILQAFEFADSQKPKGPETPPTPK